MGNSYLRIAVRGVSPARDAWLAALAALPGLTPAPARERLDAVVVAGACDIFAETKRALEDGAAVLVERPAALEAEQLRELDALARGCGRLLQLHEAFRWQPAFAFLARLLSGAEPFWRPLRVRSLRLAPAATGARADALAREELALLEELLGRSPAAVDVSPGGAPGGGEGGALCLNVAYRDGPAVQSTIGTSERGAVRQLVVETARRSIVFRDGAERPQLSIFERGASASREPLWSPSSLGAEAVDPLVSELRAFAAQVRLGSTAGNARRWIQAASLLQEGLHPGTEDEREDSLSAAPPDWRLIRGGRNDKAAPVIWERPDLRLLAAG